MAPADAVGLGQQPHAPAAGAGAFGDGPAQFHAGRVHVVKALVGAVEFEAHVDAEPEHPAGRVVAVVAAAGDERHMPCRMVERQRIDGAPRVRVRALAQVQAEHDGPRMEFGEHVAVALPNQPSQPKS